MTLHDRDVFKFYTEEIQRNAVYRVAPMDVSELADELESIYTYSHSDSYSRLEFAIGKVKKT